MANPAPPAQPAGPLDDGVMYRKFVGIKNTVTRERLGPDELEKAINVDLDDVGEFHRRRGRTLVLPGAPVASVFTSNEGRVYGVRNGILGIINPDWSFIPLQSGFNMFPQLAYVQVGDKLYYSGNSGPVPAGIIDTVMDTVTPWVGPNLGGVPPTIPPTAAVASPDYWYSPVVDPSTTLAPIGGRLLGPPPLATALAYYNGRIYLARDRLVWATMLWNYNYVDKTKNFWQFEADVTMVASVTDGLYVGTKEGCWFIGGSYNEPKRVRILDTGVVPGSLVYMPGELANPPQVGLDTDSPVKVSILFLTEGGFVGGQDSGACYNYTEDRVIFPGIQNAAAMFRMQDGVYQYVAVANSGGTPASNTRIGDFVDAELRKAGTWREGTDCVRMTEQVAGTIIPA